MSKVVVMDHPLIEQKIGIIRSRDRDSHLQDYRKTVKG